MKKLPKIPANTADKITETISKNLKKKADDNKDGVDLVGLAKKLHNRKEKVAKENDEDENNDE